MYGCSEWIHNELERRAETMRSTSDRTKQSQMQRRAEFKDRAQRERERAEHFEEVYRRCNKSKLIHFFLNVEHTPHTHTARAIHNTHTHTINNNNCCLDKFRGSDAGRQTATVNEAASCTAATVFYSMKIAGAAQSALEQHSNCIRNWVEIFRPSTSRASFKSRTQHELKPPKLRCSTCVPHTVNEATKIKNEEK